MSMSRIATRRARRAGRARPAGRRRPTRPTSSSWPTGCGASTRAASCSTSRRAHAHRRQRATTRACAARCGARWPKRFGHGVRIGRGAIAQASRDVRDRRRRRDRRAGVHPGPLRRPLRDRRPRLARAAELLRRPRPGDRGVRRLGAGRARCSARSTPGCRPTCRSSRPTCASSRCAIGAWADIGVNAVILPGVTVGQGRDRRRRRGGDAATCPPFAIVAGVPARFVRWREGHEKAATETIDRVTRAFDRRRHRRRRLHRLGAGAPARRARRAGASSSTTWSTASARTSPTCCRDDVTLLEHDIRDLDARGAAPARGAASCITSPASASATRCTRRTRTTTSTPRRRCTCSAASREAGVPRFVYVSSSEVYGTAQLGADDRGPPDVSRARSTARSKLAGECYARAYYRTYGYPDGRRAAVQHLRPALASRRRQRRGDSEVPAALPGRPADDRLRRRHADARLHVRQRHRGAASCSPASIRGAVGADDQPRQRQRGDHQRPGAAWSRGGRPAGRRSSSTIGRGPATCCGCTPTCRARARCSATRRACRWPTGLRALLAVVSRRSRRRPRSCSSRRSCATGCRRRCETPAAPRPRAPDDSRRAALARRARGRRGAPRDPLRLGDAGSRGRGLRARVRRRGRRAARLRGLELHDGAAPGAPGRRRRPGDEVVTVSHSFIATANAIRYCGATPVFVDVELDTFNIDPGARRGRRSRRRTKAMLVVHQLGMPCDLARLVAAGARAAACR